MPCPSLVSFMASYIVGAQEEMKRPSLPCNGGAGLRSAEVLWVMEKTRGSSKYDLCAGCHGGRMD